MGSVAKRACACRGICAVLRLAGTHRRQLQKIWSNLVPWKSFFIHLWQKNGPTASTANTCALKFCKNGARTKPFQPNMGMGSERSHAKFGGHTANWERVQALSRPQIFTSSPILGGFWQFLSWILDLSIQKLRHYTKLMHRASKMGRLLGPNPLESKVLFCSRFSSQKIAWLRYRKIGLFVQKFEHAGTEFIGSPRYRKKLDFTQNTSEWVGPPKHYWHVSGRCWLCSLNMLGTAFAKSSAHVC